VSALSHNVSLPSLGVAEMTGSTAGCMPHEMHMMSLACNQVLPHAFIAHCYVSCWAHWGSLTESTLPVVARTQVVSGIGCLGPSDAAAILPMSPTWGGATAVFCCSALHTQWTSGFCQGYGTVQHGMYAPSTAGHRRHCEELVQVQGQPSAVIS
jgi:hypothetical protein